MTYSSAAGLARFTKAAIVIDLIVGFLMTLSLGAQAYLLGVPVDAAPEGGASTGVALGMCCTGLGSLGMLVISGVVFFMWLHRTTKNALSLGAELDFSPGLAIGQWFIPFANLYLPLRTMQALDVAAANEQELAAVVGRKDTVLWWGLWLVAGALGAIGNVADPGVMRQFWSQAAVWPARAACALVLFGILNRITQNMDRKAGQSSDASPTQF